MNSEIDPLASLPRAFQLSEARAVVRAAPEDFVVEEIVSTQPDDDGPHLWLQVRKRDLTTVEVAAALARHAGVKARDVGYAGLKDRRAVAVQWFSINGETMSDSGVRDWLSFVEPGIAVQRVERHARKLRRGWLTGNRFRLRLTDFRGDHGWLVSRAEAIAARGFPNYFGPQRFGRDGDNLIRADRMLRGEGRSPRAPLRGIYLSTVRAHLFNKVLAARVEQNNWDVLVDGDAVVREGARRGFRAEGSREAGDGSLTEAMADQALHPSGPMCGSGANPTTGQAELIEADALQDQEARIEGLIRFGLQHERRALRAQARELSVGLPDDGAVAVQFALGRGSYATSLLRELIVGP